MPLRDMRAWDTDDGSWIVGGTLSPRQAAAWLRENKDVEVDVKKGKSSWLRIVPGCPYWCGEGHDSHWFIARENDRGAFKAVTFS